MLNSRRTTLRVVFLVQLWICVANADSGPGAKDEFCFQGSSWPAADKMFRHDSHWVGADGAHSIELGAGRTLWLFGDTLIDVTGRQSRSAAQMIRNSVAIQRGTNPATAHVRFFWPAEANGRPGSFFNRRDDQWYWPGHGIRLGDRLLIFLARLRSTSEGLGFEAAGWNAVMISNPDDEPSEWQIIGLETPSNPLGVVVGFAGVLRSGDYLYAFGSQNPVKTHPVFAVRWLLADAERGQLLMLEWWAGADHGWVQDSSTVPRWPILEFGQSEMSILEDQQTGAFLAVHTQGFGRADIALRTARAITGPWSQPTPIYRPPEYDRAKVLLYAAKAHPQLTGAEMVLTYATNTSDFSEIRTDSEIYYPRFVRLSRCAATTMRHTSTWSWTATTTGQYLPLSIPKAGAQE